MNMQNSVPVPNFAPTAALPLPPYNRYVVGNNNDPCNQISIAKRRRIDQEIHVIKQMEQAVHSAVTSLISIAQQDNEPPTISNEFDAFARNISMQLQTLPICEALRCQEMILKIIQVHRNHCAQNDHRNYGVPTPSPSVSGRIDTVRESADNTDRILQIPMSIALAGPPQQPECNDRSVVAVNSATVAVQPNNREQPYRTEPTNCVRRDIVCEALASSSNFENDAIINHGNENPRDANYTIEDIICESPTMASTSQPGPSNINYRNENQRDVNCTQDNIGEAPTASVPSIMSISDNRYENQPFANYTAGEKINEAPTASQPSSDIFPSIHFKIENSDTGELISPIELQSEAPLEQPNFVVENAQIKVDCQNTLGNELTECSRGSDIQYQIYEITEMEEPFSNETTDTHCQSAHNEIPSPTSTLTYFGTENEEPMVTKPAPNFSGCIQREYQRKPMVEDEVYEILDMNENRGINSSAVADSPYNNVYCVDDDEDVVDILSDSE